MIFPHPPLKVIIAGSRSIVDYDLVKRIYFMSNMQATEIISGCAKGVDTLAIRLAEELHIPCVKIPADWKKNGRGAGFQRNVDMAESADTLIAIWDGASNGTAHMIQMMRDRGKSVFIFNTLANTTKASYGGIDNKG